MSGLRPQKKKRKLVLSVPVLEGTASDGFSVIELTLQLLVPSMGPCNGVSRIFHRILIVRMSYFSVVSAGIESISAAN